MQKGDRAQLCAKKMLRTDQDLDENVFGCSVCEYNPAEECIYLILQEGELTDITLDAFYSCKVLREEETMECVGNVVQRYCDETGKMLKFKIKKGFYKINLKCVDK